jgi:hypothetical protein
MDVIHICSIDSRLIRRCLHGLLTVRELANRPFSGTKSYKSSRSFTF